jgi:hypothetical protein
VKGRGRGKEAYWITVSLSLTILKKRLGGLRVGRLD